MNNQMSQKLLNQMSQKLLNQMSRTMNNQAGAVEVEVKEKDMAKVKGDAGNLDGRVAELASGCIIRCVESTLAIGRRI